MQEAYFGEIQTICQTACFAQKGKSFFRVWGDGVLQVIKYEYERKFRAYEILIGLFSMYDQLPQKRFTAGGCLAEYSVVNCYEQNDLPQAFAHDMAVQIGMLRERVIPWLNTIDTQKKLITAIRTLDRRWNDGLKIGPYLACGEGNHAKKVVKEILQQNGFGMPYKEAMKKIPIDELLSRLARDGTDFYALVGLIDAGDSAIQTHLKGNYERNMKYAAFCVQTQKKTDSTWI